MKKRLSLEVNEHKISKQEAMQAVLEISKKFTPKIEELSDTLYKL